jgi:hypothetical protein
VESKFISVLFKLWVVILPEEMLTLRATVILLYFFNL